MPSHTVVALMILGLYTDSAKITKFFSVVFAIFCSERTASRFAVTKAILGYGHYGHERQGNAVGMKLLVRLPPHDSGTPVIKFSLTSA